MTKPVIVAICGKSASGKDTLAKAFQKGGYGFTNIVSDTTRPPRQGEVDGINYNFIPPREFTKRMRQEEYLEFSEFRGWYYGTNKQSVSGSVNIGVFNMDGIVSLLQFSRKDEYTIIPVYLKVNVFTRLCRSIKRERKISLEMIRRVLADWFDFIDADLWLECFPQYVVVKNLKTMQDYDNLTQHIVDTYLSDYYQQGQNHKKT